MGGRGVEDRRICTCTAHGTMLWWMGILGEMGGGRMGERLGSTGGHKRTRYEGEAAGEGGTEDSGYVWGVTETELKTVCELREKDQRRVQALENEIAKKYPVRATDGETAAVPSMSEADQLKMAQLEKQCKQLRAKNEEDVAKYRRLLREKDKEFTLVKQNEAAKLREAYNIINTQSVDLSRLDIKSKQLEVAVSESTKSTLMAEQHKVSVTKSIREVTQRCQILEEKHIKIQHVESMRPVETRAADVSAQQLQAQIAELRLQLDFKTSEIGRAHV